MARLFLFLFIGHLIGDFVLQTNEMINSKIDDYFILLLHSLIYSVVVTVMALNVTMAFTPLLLIFLIVLGVHILLDMRKLTGYIIKLIHKDELPFWITVVIDQSFHIIVLIIISELLVGGGLI